MTISKILNKSNTAISKRYGKKNQLSGVSKRVAKLKLLIQARSQIQAGCPPGTNSSGVMLLVMLCLLNQQK